MNAFVGQKNANTLAVVATIWISLLAGIPTQAADFTVRTPGGQFAFSINGVDTPTLSLVRGRTYTFDVQTSSIHPFRINSAAASPGNGVTSGTVTFVVPTNAVNYTYDCTIHASLRGNINTVAPPVPPTPRLVSFAFGDSIVLRSAPGTNTFGLFPEYKTDFNTTNWFALTVQSNRFLNGTNETFCGRPPGSNVFFRVRVQ